MGANWMSIGASTAGLWSWMRLVNGMGNPGVFLGVPVPLPGKTHTPDQGYRFLRGTNVQTPGSPIPVPLAGYPWVFAIFQQFHTFSSCHTGPYTLIYLFVPLLLHSVLL